jgi:hypothetical protein
LGGAPKFETSFVNLIMSSFSFIKKINLWQNMSLKFNIVFFFVILCSFYVLISTNMYMFFFFCWYFWIWIWIT